jgi:RNA polymerase sigma-70 factor (ECF subfamily)
MHSIRDDEADFERAVAPYRTELLAHCYRMLASRADAEDALQETMLRAWRGLSGFEGRSSLRSWLYTIATNASLKLIEKRPKRIVPVDFGPPGDPHEPAAEPLVESVFVGPLRDAPEATYEERESVELAFIAAVQHLPARQRAVLLLRDVLGFSGAEVAEALDSTPAAVYSALQRAHQVVDERLPEQTQQATLRALGDDRIREIVEDYMRAWQSGDIAALRELLAEDALLTMPPRPTWFRGRDAIGTFLSLRPLAPEHEWSIRPTRANGQVAFESSFRDRETGEPIGTPALQLLTLNSDGLITELCAFHGADGFEPLT